MLRRSELRRKTPMPRSSSLLRRTPLASNAEPVRRSKATKPDVPASVRRAVRDRSGGVCEACGADRAEHVHHRKLRSQGGKHEPANLLHLSHACHAEIHANPERAYGLGLLVRRADDPASVPVRMFGVGPGELYGGCSMTRWCYIDDCRNEATHIVHSYPDTVRLCDRHKSLHPVEIGERLCTGSDCTLCGDDA